MKRTLLCLFALLSVPAVHLIAQQKGAAGNDKTKLAPYYPTPASVVDKMLALAGVKPGEKVFDLGSGDGRIPIAAARKYKALGVGVELDESLVRQSMERVRTLGLTPMVKIIQGDLLEQDYTSADVLTIYLLPVAIEKVTPILEKQLKKGARVVVHDFEFFTWNPAAKVVDIDDDGEGRSHRLFLYKR
ncbi:MAG: methyltransferase domain-containing protein [Bryobacteraceae bacterium]